MNKTFKVAKSLTRGTVVTSEKASSYQGKAVKTVIAAAVALAAGSALAATWVDAPKADEDGKYAEGVYAVTDAAGEAAKVAEASKLVIVGTKAGVNSSPFLTDVELTSDKALWVVGTTADAQTVGMAARAKNAVNSGVIYVTAQDQGIFWKQSGMKAVNGQTAVNNGTIITKNGYAMGFYGTEATSGAFLVNNGQIYVLEKGVGFDIGGQHDGSNDDVSLTNTATNAGLIQVESAEGYGVQLDEITQGAHFINAKGGVIDAKAGAAAIYVKSGSKNTIDLLEGSSVLGKIAVVPGASADLNGLGGTVDGSLETLGTLNLGGELEVASVVVGSQNSGKTETEQGKTSTAVKAAEGTFNVTTNAALKVASASVVNGTFTVAGEAQADAVTLGGAAKAATSTADAVNATSGTLAVSGGDFTAGTITLGNAASAINVTNSGVLTADTIAFAASAAEKVSKEAAAGLQVTSGKATVGDLVFANTTDAVNVAAGSTLTITGSVVAKDADGKDLTSLTGVTNSGTISTSLANVGKIEGSTGELKVTATAFGAALQGDAGTLSTTYDGQFTIDDYTKIAAAIGNVELHGATLVGEKQPDGTFAQATFDDAKKVGYAGNTDVVTNYGTAHPTVEATDRNVTIKTLELVANEGAVTPSDFKLNYAWNDTGTGAPNTTHTITIRGNGTEVFKGFETGGDQSQLLEITASNLILGETESDAGTIANLITYGSGDKNAIVGSFDFTNADGVVIADGAQLNVTGTLTAVGVSNAGTNNFTADGGAVVLRGAYPEAEAAPAAEGESANAPKDISRHFATGAVKLTNGSYLALGEAVAARAADYAAKHEGTQG